MAFYLSLRNKEAGWFNKLGMDSRIFIIFTVY